jgi:hypothetical protein
MTGRLLQHLAAQLRSGAWVDMLRFTGMKSGSSITCGSLSGSEANAAPGVSYALASAPPSLPPPAFPLFGRPAGSCVHRLRSSCVQEIACATARRLPLLGLSRRACLPLPISGIDFSYGVQALTNAWTIAQISYTMVAQSSISPS